MFLQCVEFFSPSWMFTCLNAALTTLMSECNIDYLTTLCGWLIFVCIQVIILNMVSSSQHLWLPLLEHTSLHCVYYIVSSSVLFYNYFCNQILLGLLGPHISNWKTNFSKLQIIENKRKAKYRNQIHTNDFTISINISSKALFSLENETDEILALWFLVMPFFKLICLLALPIKI